jgi:hypothetical protein
MKYVLEIYHQGECIEQRVRSTPHPEPLPGEQIYIDFANRSYSEEYGNWWVIRSRRHLLFSEQVGRQTLMLHCEPDLRKGAPAE